MAAWWRRPLWWPAITLVIVLIAGLLVLAVGADGAGAAVHVYAPAERPQPLPVEVAPARLVDLNRASLAELEALPGIGAQRARAIMDARAANPFASLGEVAERGVLPRSVAEGLVRVAGVRP